MTRASLAGLTALLLASCAHAGRGVAPPWPALPALGPLQAALLYHQQAGVPAPDDKLVQWFGEVCGEADEAARAQAAAAARPRLAEAAREAAGTSRWVVPVAQTLGGYDLVQGGFPTNLRDGTVVRFGPSDYCRQELAYLLVLRTGGDFGIVRVSQEDATAWVRQNRERTVIHDVEVEVDGAQPAAPAPAVFLRVLRVRTRDAVKGTVIGDSGAGG